MEKTKLEKLEEKKAQIENQIKKLEAVEKDKKRKQETRKKILAGALALEHTKKNPHSDFAKKMNALLNEYVTKSGERELFGLPPLSEKPPTVPAENPSKLQNDFHS